MPLKSKAVNPDWSSKSPNIWDKTPSVPLLWMPPKDWSVANLSSTLVPQSRSQSVQPLSAVSSTSLVNQLTKEVQSTPTSTPPSTLMPQNLPILSVVLVSGRLSSLWNLSTTSPRPMVVTLSSPVSVNVLVKVTICTTK